MSNMFDDGGNDQDQELKDKLLESLVEHMEDILGGGLKGRAGLGVKVEAADPDSLKAGLDQAKDVVAQHGDELGADGKAHLHGGGNVPMGGMYAEGGAVQDRSDDSLGGDHAEDGEEEGESLDITNDERFAKGGAVKDVSKGDHGHAAQDDHLKGLRSREDDDSDESRLMDLFDEDGNEKKKNKF